MQKRTMMIRRAYEKDEKIAELIKEIYEDYKGEKGNRHAKQMKSI